MKSDNRKAIYAAFFANLGIAIAKFVGFFLTGAASMLAEAVHSVADTGNQGLLLLGGKWARRKPSKEHPFGYGQESYFWAFVVAVVIFVLGGVFAITEGIDKLRHPHEIESPLVAVCILVAGIFLEGGSLITAIKAANKIRGENSFWQFIHKTKQADLSVVLLEDLGAVLGLIIALAGIIVAHFTGNPRYDAIGSICIGTLLCVIAVILARELRGLLTGEAAGERRTEKIKALLLSVPSVKRLIHMRTMHFGANDILIGAKLQFDNNLTLEALTKEINKVENAVREGLSIGVVIYIEPDFFEPDAGER